MKTKNKFVKPGDIFYNWTILHKSGPKGHSLCRCVCGTEKIVRNSHMKSGGSTSCGCKAEAKKVKTNIEKYGVSTPLADKNKMKDAINSKYGVDNSMQVDSVKEKARQTIFSNYGVECAFNIESSRKKALEEAWTEASRAARISTNIEKYGETHPVKNADVRKKTRNTSIMKYGEIHFAKTQEFREFMQINNPMYDENNVNKFKETLLSRYGVSRLTDLPQFKKATTRFSIGEQSLSEYMKINNIDHVGYNAVAKVFRSTGSASAALRYIEDRKTGSLTAPELLFIHIMESHFPGMLKFDKKVLENRGFRPDFKIETDVGGVIYINIDGLFPHSSLCKEKEYHRDVRKAFLLEEKRIVQIYSDELTERPEAILSFIRNLCHKNTNKIAARNTIVEEVKFFEIAPLLEMWHLMGAGPISRSVSLFYNDEIVSIMTYKVQEAKGIVSIERFANTPGHTIQGGFGKLVSFLEKKFPYLDIVSFCDTRYAVGSSYLALGFEEESESLGFYWTDFVNRFNRYYCQAVPGIKTEEENSLDMGLVKIYDAGQVKFRKKSKLSKE